MKKAKKIIIPIVAVILSIAILFGTILILIVGGLYGSIWFIFFDTGNYKRYKNEPIREIEANDSRVYFVTEDGDGYFFGGYSCSLDVKYINNENRNNNRLGAPYPLRFYDGEITYIYPYAYVNCLFITEDGDLHLMYDTSITEIAQNVSLASCLSDSRICYVTVDGTLKVVDNDSHVTLIESGVRDARIFEDDVYVLWDNGNLDKYVWEGNECTFSENILDDVQKIDADLTYDGTNYNEKCIILNVLQNDCELYAKGAYGLCNQDETYKYGDLETERYKDLTLIGEGVVDFSLANSGTIMQLSDGNAKYVGYDTGRYYEKTANFGEQKIDIANLKTACVFERMIFCIDENNLMYLWGGYGNEFYSPLGKGNGYDIFVDPPITVDFGKKEIKY